MPVDRNIDLDSHTPLKRFTGLIGALALANALLIAAGVFLRPASAAGFGNMLGVIAPLSVQCGYWRVVLGACVSLTIGLRSAQTVEQDE